MIMEIPYAFDSIDDLRYIRLFLPLYRHGYIEVLGAADGDSTSYFLGSISLYSKHSGRFNIPEKDYYKLFGKIEPHLENARNVFSEFVASENPSEDCLRSMAWIQAAVDEAVGESKLGKLAGEALRDKKVLAMKRRRVINNNQMELIS